MEKVKIYRSKGGDFTIYYLPQDTDPEDVNDLNQTDLCFHRTDGPAYIETVGGYASYWEYDVLHRYDGPVYVYDGNLKAGDQWRIRGKVVDEGKYKAWLLEQDMDIFNLSDNDKILIDLKWGSE